MLVGKLFFQGEPLEFDGFTSQRPPIHTRYPRRFSFNFGFQHLDTPFEHRDLRIVFSEQLQLRQLCFGGNLFVLELGDLLQRNGSLLLRVDHAFFVAVTG